MPGTDTEFSESEMPAAENDAESRLVPEMPTVEKCPESRLDPEMPALEHGADSTLEHVEAMGVAAFVTEFPEINKPVIPAVGDGAESRWEPVEAMGTACFLCTDACATRCGEMGFGTPCALCLSALTPPAPRSSARTSPKAVPGCEFPTRLRTCFTMSSTSCCICWTSRISLPNADAACATSFAPFVAVCNCVAAWRAACSLEDAYLVGADGVVEPGDERKPRLPMEALPLTPGPTYVGWF